ncbi:MAG: hypothetical protein HDR71_17735 [Lachnospiraceae bacterium]|nr:hypothetical protein [Lachnospiraceae bacterium]
MSRGIGAHANKVFEDNETIIYEYGGYNLNDKKFRNENHIYDGSILIPRSCFVEPEIHKKMKKMPNGKRKLITKRIPILVEYEKMIEEGIVVIKNCSHCWYTTNDARHIDMMALRILSHVFQQYQVEGEIPEYISYNV